jgi:lipoate-protein ligase A
MPNALGVPASVNERNDVVVDKFKMSWVYTCAAPGSHLFFHYVSGSAYNYYEIANKRAYHHGMTLVNPQLNSLGDLLKNQKVRSLV